MLILLIYFNSFYNSNKMHIDFIFLIGVRGRVMEMGCFTGSWEVCVCFLSQEACLHGFLLSYLILLLLPFLSLKPTLLHLVLRLQCKDKDTIF